MVKIVIGNIYSKIVGFLPEEVQSDLYDILAYRVENAYHMPLFKKGKWDGYVRLYQRNKSQSFHTGLLGIVRDILTKHNIEFAKIDDRERPAQNLPDLVFTPPPNFEEREYQEFTINKAIKFTRGILSVATGGGKTSMVTQIIGRLKTYPFLFYVLTKDLMEQAYDTLSLCLNEPIGRIGDSRYDIKKINVCTIQTAIRSLNIDNPKFKISDYQFDDEDGWNEEKLIEDMDKNQRIRKLINLTRGIYFDEAHHAAAKTVKEVLSASPSAYWRFGGSATPYRESGDEIMIQAMFGGKIVDIPASYLIKNDYLVPPHIFFVPIDTSIDYHSFPKIYKHCVVTNNHLNDHVAKTANHLVSRGLSTLVLVKHYPQGNYLKERIENSEFVTGKMSTKKRKENLERLRNRELMCMIATSLADEGLDVPTLDAAILAGGGKSSTRLNQRIGRTIRKEKEGLKNKSIVVVYDHYKTRFLKKHTKRVKTILKKEKEFCIIESKGMDFVCDEIDETIGIKSNSDNIFKI